MNKVFDENSSPSDTTNRINLTCAEAFSEPSTEISYSLQTSENLLCNPISNQEIVSSHLKVGKAAGNDYLTPRQLKVASDVLMPHLTYILCLSLSSCEVPSRWKTAHVVPIPKKSCTTISDFRPLSLLPRPSK